jgi:lambda repressor-like predicted transcriptional regulator
MNRTRWLATAAAGLVVVVGGGVALAANGSNDPASDFLGDVSKRLGISKDKLEGAIEDASIARIDAAVDAGKLTKEEGEELKAAVRSGDGPVLLPGLRKRGFDGPGLVEPGFGPPDKGFGPPDMAFFPGIDLIETAADYLGIEPADVREALRDGKSLADLAKDKGKSVDGLEDALRAQIRKDVDQAVDDGKLTKEQADRVAEKLSAGVEDLVEHGGPHFGLKGARPAFGPIGPPEKRFVFPGFDLIETAADYLGVELADLREALADGKSLADVAKEKGKSVDGLKDALRAQLREDDDQRIDDLVEGKFEHRMPPAP